MITEIHFVHAVTVPGTQMRQTEFRAKQGWSIEVKPESVMLSHDQHGTFWVQMVGFSLSLGDVDKKAQPGTVVPFTQAASRGGKKNR